MQFPDPSSLTHYLLVVCIWSLQLLLWLTTLAVSLMLILSFLILCLAVSLMLIRRWFPLFLPLLCRPTLWPWLHMLRLLGHSRTLRSLSVRSLCRPRVLRPALPRLWPLGSVLAALHRRWCPPPTSSSHRYCHLGDPQGSNFVQGGRYYVQDLDPLRAPRGCESYLSRAIETQRS